ncbi:MAG: DUF3108 domain-containing protein [Bryobacteraceae bacterium]
MTFKHLLALCLIGLALAQHQPPKGSRFPYPEKLSYRIEWRLGTAGTATVQLSRASLDHWQLELDLESAGMVNRLYRVLDKYKVISNDHFCPSTSVLDAQEGKRHRLTRLTFENLRHKVVYEERDLINNRTSKRVLDVSPCTRDIAGALAALRLMNIEPGQSANLPITDGKKMVNARVDAKSRENVSVADKTYRTIRYEAFLFDNVLYKRKGRLFVWLTDDTDRIPVQLRFQLGFPIGTISLELQEQQKL